MYHNTLMHDGVGGTAGRTNLIPSWPFMTYICFQAVFQELSKASDGPTRPCWQAYSDVWADINVH